MSGAYSSTPLFKKLGLKDGMNSLFINPPKGYVEQFKKEIKPSTSVAPFDFIQLFSNSQKEFETELLLLKNQLKKNGILWVSWYKKASKKPTEITEDIIRNYALEIGLVDVKVCSVDDDWSGLKLVFRLKDR
jgi:hypothetical protein